MSCELRQKKAARPRKYCAFESKTYIHSAWRPKLPTIRQQSLSLKGITIEFLECTAENATPLYNRMLPPGTSMSFQAIMQRLALLCQFQACIFAECTAVVTQGIRGQD